MAPTAANTSDFEAKVNSLRNLKLDALGIKIVDLGITSINLVAPGQATTAKPMTATTPSADFQQAQQIKARAESQAQASLNQLAAHNPQFFAYFMRIKQLESSVSSKEEVPPLSQLYPKGH